MNGPAAVLIPGNRLHLQHGPIDLIIWVDGTDVERAAAFGAAQSRFRSILTELMHEIELLRHANGPKPSGQIAARMWTAVSQHSGFVTPMAAVAGSVADTVLNAMRAEAPHIKRAYVNNGGDIALYLMGGTSFETAMLHESGADLGRISVKASDPVRGIATSGRGGRSLSMGIADSVTVLAADAAQADVAATLIANAIDLPDHPDITRAKADDLVPGSDLMQRLIPTHVPMLTSSERKSALQLGRKRAIKMQNAGLIHAASLFLQGETLHVHHSPKLEIHEGRHAYA